MALARAARLRGDPFAQLRERGIETLLPRRIPYGQEPPLQIDTGNGNGDEPAGMQVLCHGELADDGRRDPTEHRSAHGGIRMHFERWGSEGKGAKRPHEHFSRARALFPGDQGSAGKLRCLNSLRLGPRVVRRNNGHEVVEGNGSHAELSRLLSALDET